MYLQTVSIRGFKSFANKSILRFEPGITVIVGPNGSGKSNITDGVLWALGEQSAKTLRGSSMEDVIFSGSADKNALGAAEVSITLDNSDGAIPIDFSEVTITRRLYRSGESEYLLNRNPCRLIDIQEMISDSGLGREMYSVISQGRLDDILNSKPRDRRQLLEEAAGVLKYKRRRDRALRKLKAMEQNLTRGKDILREVNRQLAPLQRQADMAKEYERLEQDLRAAQTAGAVGRLRRLRSQWEELSAGHEGKESRIEKLNTELLEVQVAIDELEAELEAKGALSGDIGEYRRRLAGLSERINSGLLLLEEKGKNLVAKLSELRQSIHSLERRASQARTDREALLEEKEGLDEELGELYKRLNRERRTAEDVKKAAKQVAEGVAEARGALEKAKDRRAELDREVNQRHSAIESTTEKISFLREQQAALAQKRTSVVDEHDQAVTTKTELDQALLAAKERVAQATREIEAARQARTSAAERHEHAAGELAEARARAGALEALEANAAPDFAWFDEERKSFPNILGSLSAQLNVEARYERAIESALGLDMHTLVASDRAGAVEVFRHTKQRGDNPVRVLAPAVSGEVAEPAPGLRRGADVVDCPPSVQRAAQTLLERVWITDELDRFLEGGASVPPGGIVVDELGDYVDSRGVIVRRAAGDISQGSLATRRQLSEARGRMAAAAAEIDSAKVELAKAEETFAAIQKEEGRSQTESQRLDGRVVAVSMRLQSLERDIVYLDEQEREVEKGLAEKEKRLEETKAIITRLETDLGEARSDVGSKQTALDERQEAGAASLEAEKKATSLLSEAQVAMASLTERQTHLKSRLILVSDEMERAESDLFDQNKIAAATEELRHRVQPVHDLYTALRLAAEVRTRELAGQDESEQAGSARLREELRGLHARVRALNADLNLANSELVTAAETKTQVETEVHQITRFLVDELGVALETALARPDEGRQPEDWAVRERRLRSKLEGMGPVNQIAAGEFTKLEERQTFLTKQMDDLVRSQKALRTVLKAIDKKIAARFEETLQEVNESFQKVFQELFPGGTAGLTLVEEEDEDSEPGVEIVARPEGKRLQSLSLLSGGERSLVGLALLFALHDSRPSPFYILDEVEAALDTINLGRFIRLMRKLKGKTQFLVITHQRLTMEIADSIYGVSMQADGVSKVISQKLSPEERVDGRGEEGRLVASAIGRPEEVEDQS